jgi:hypothetical protein
MNGFRNKGVSRITAAIILFIISAFLFIITLHYGLGVLKPGVYPPKQVLKSKAITLGCAAGILLLIAIIIFYLT